MAAPVTVAEAVTHLRLGSVTTEESAELQVMIDTAYEWAESFCNRSFVAGTKTKTFDDFPPIRTARKQQGLALCGGVVSGITSVTYYDSDFVQQTLAADQYRLVVGSGRSQIYPAMGGDWPTDVASEAGHISVAYSVGDDANVPSSVKSAILLILGSLYENREQGVIDTAGLATVKAPVAAEHLLFPYKLRH